MTLVRAKMNSSRPTTPTARESTGPPSHDIPGQIAKLAELRDAGILSEEEFADKKAELLRRL